MIYITVLFPLKKFWEPTYKSLLSYCMLPSKQKKNFPPFSTVHHHWAETLSKTYEKHALCAIGTIFSQQKFKESGKWLWITREVVMDNSAFTSQSNECMQQYSRVNLYFRFIPSTTTEKTNIALLSEKMYSWALHEARTCNKQNDIIYSVQIAIYISANNNNINIVESHPIFFTPLLSDLPSKPDYLQVLSSV